MAGLGAFPALGEGESPAWSRSIESSEGQPCLPGPPRRRLSGMSTPLAERVKEHAERMKEQANVDFDVLISLRPGLYPRQIRWASIARQIRGKLASRFSAYLRISGPVQFFSKTVDRWQLTEDEASLLLGLAASDHLTLRRIQTGGLSAAGRDIQDRIAAILTIRRILRGLCGSDPAAEREWLRSAKPELNGETPIARMTVGGMDGLLFVRDYLRWQAGL